MIPEVNPAFCGVEGVRQQHRHGAIDRLGHLERAPDEFRRQFRVGWIGRDIFRRPRPLVGQEVEAIVVDRRYIDRTLKAGSTS